MLVQLLNTVTMFTVITASILGSQDEMDEVDYYMGSLHNKVAELPSKVAELPFSHDSEEEMVEVYYPIGFLPRVETEKPLQSMQGKIIDVDYSMGSLPSIGAQLPSQASIHGRQGQKIDVDYSMGSLSSKVAGEPFQQLPNLSDKLAELPLSLPNENDYPMGYLPSKMKERIFYPLPNFSSKVAIQPSEASIHGRRGQIFDVDYPMSSLYSEVAEMPFPLQPNFSSKESQLPSQASIHGRQVQKIDVDYPMGFLSSKVTERPFRTLPLSLSKVAKRPFHLSPNLSSKLAEILDEMHVYNPTKLSSPSSYDKSKVTTKSNESMLSTMSDESMIKAKTDELMMKTNFNSVPYFNVQGRIEGYGSDINNNNLIQHCIWYDSEKEKEYQLQSGTRWSGNGCKSLECKDGEIIPDPTCCKIETHLNGYTSIYYLYRNHGEKWIKACELLLCDSGLITKHKRIPGCCVYDHTGSKADGESWWAYSAGHDNNFCKVGTCNNGKIEVMQIDEGGSWRNGCFDHICKDSDFVMNRVNLPGSCNINHGGCIVNGTIEKIWPKCQGIFCINGNLYKGEMKYCSEKALLLYKRYNI